MRMTLKEHWYSLTPDEKQKAAEAVGTSAPHLSHIVHGRRRPSIKMAVRLEEALGEPWTRERLRPDLAELFGREPAA